MRAIPHPPAAALLQLLAWLAGALRVRVKFFAACPRNPFLQMHLPIALFASNPFALPLPEFCRARCTSLSRTSEFVRRPWPVRFFTNACSPSPVLSHIGHLLTGYADMPEFRGGTPRAPIHLNTPYDVIFPIWQIRGMYTIIDMKELRSFSCRRCGRPPMCSPRVPSDRRTADCLGGVCSQREVCSQAGHRVATDFKPVVH